MTTKSDPTKELEFQRVLKNLLNAPPKPHSKMKIGRRAKSRTKKRDQKQK
ncbi:MAG: hypothetical protein ABSE22_09690 [Xanthobacteraceae bacterium]